MDPFDQMMREVVLGGGKPKPKDEDLVRTVHELTKDAPSHPHEVLGWAGLAMNAQSQAQALAAERLGEERARREAAEKTAGQSRTALWVVLGVAGAALIASLIAVLSMRRQ